MHFNLCDTCTRQNSNCPLDCVEPVDSCVEYFEKIALKFSEPKPDLLSFRGDQNSEIGRLIFKDGMLNFEGNATESAKLFFDQVIMIYRDRIMDEKDKLQVMYDEKCSLYNKINSEKSRFRDVLDKIVVIFEKHPEDVAFAFQCCYQMIKKALKDDNR